MEYDICYNNGADKWVNMVSPVLFYPYILYGWIWA